MNELFLELSIVYDRLSYNKIYSRIYLENNIAILEEEGKIKICFPESQKSRIENLVVQLIHLDGIRENNITIREFSRVNWNDEWRNSIEPVFIKKKIVIFPSWKKEQVKKIKNIIKIEIDPKMAFGTGHNETTQLILGKMCRYIDTNDRTMLDFGCGTSILAIAGVKLGLQNVIAIDIDKEAIINSKECIRKNKSSGYIRLFQKDISAVKEKDFDIISANLTSMLILQKLSQIKKKLKPNGKLFLTGILTKEASGFTSKIKKGGFRLISKEEKAGWSCFYFRKA